MSLRCYIMQLFLAKNTRRALLVWATLLVSCQALEYRRQMGFPVVLLVRHFNLETSFLCLFNDGSELCAN